MNPMPQNQVPVLVYGASFAEIEGKKFVSLYIGQPSSDPTRYKGIEIMKADSTAEVFAAIPEKTEFPAMFNVTLELKRIGGGKMGQVCTAIAPVRSVSPAKS